MISYSLCFVHLWVSVLISIYNREKRLRCRLRDVLIWWVGVWNTERQAGGGSPGRSQGFSSTFWAFIGYIICKYFLPFYRLSFFTFLMVSFAT